MRHNEGMREQSKIFQCSVYTHTHWFLGNIQHKMRNDLHLSHEINIDTFCLSSRHSSLAVGLGLMVFSLQASDDQPVRCYATFVVYIFNCICLASNSWILHVMKPDMVSNHPTLIRDGHIASDHRSSTYEPHSRIKKKHNANVGVTS